MAKKNKLPAKRLPNSGMKLIRKANELVEARYKFDIWEMRVFAKMLTMLRSDDKDLKRYDIPVNDLLKDFNLSNKGDNYQSIKDAAKRLLTRVIEIEKDTTDGVQWFATSLLVGAEGYKNPTENSTIRVQFHPDLRPYLLELKERYLVYDIRNLWGLSSVYSIRIYELLKQYERIGRRRFWVEDLRIILGIDEKEYPMYANFKQKVIQKAQKDLAASSDITFTLEEEKDGRRIVAITFVISPNPARRNANALPDEVQKQAEARQKMEVLNSPVFLQIFEQVKLWGIAETTLRAIMLEHDEERVRQAVECTKENLRDGKIRENAGGFFIKAVEEGWQSQQQLKKMQAEVKMRASQQKHYETLETLENWETHLDNLLSNRRNAANEIIRQLTQTDPEVANRAVEALLGNTFSRTFLENSTGLILDQLDMEQWRQNKQLRDAVLREIEKQHPPQFLGIQQQFDENIRVARRQIEILRAEINKSS